jgi:hypothetical protein
MHGALLGGAEAGGSSLTFPMVAHLPCPGPAAEVVREPTSQKTNRLCVRCAACRLTLVSGPWSPTASVTG